jgi:hypothetical protein
MRYDSLSLIYSNQNISSVLSFTLCKFSRSEYTFPYANLLWELLTTSEQISE